MDNSDTRTKQAAAEKLPGAQEENLPEDRPGLEKRLTELKGELAACQARIRELSAAENPAAGLFFAAEIHAARQEKLVLEFKKELCRVKLNRLNL